MWPYYWWYSNVDFPAWLLPHYLIVWWLNNWLVVLIVLRRRYCIVLLLLENNWYYVYCCYCYYYLFLFNSYTNCISPTCVREVWYWPMATVWWPVLTPQCVGGDPHLLLVIIGKPWLIIGQWLLTQWMCGSDRLFCIIVGDWPIPLLVTIGQR